MAIGFLFSSSDGRLHSSFYTLAGDSRFAAHAWRDFLPGLLSPIPWHHIDNFLEAAEVIRDSGRYGWRRSGIWIQNPSPGAP
jgi:hypothetical protein